MNFVTRKRTIAFIIFALVCLFVGFAGMVSTVLILANWLYNL